LKDVKYLDMFAFIMKLPSSMHTQITPQYALAVKKARLSLWKPIGLCDVEAATFSRLVVFAPVYPYPRGYAKTFSINQNETQEPLEPWTSPDPHTHEDSSPN
jgi:hypothetical protein